MASAKAHDKPVGFQTSLFGQASKEPPEASEGTDEAPATKSARRKAKRKRRKVERKLMSNPELISVATKSVENFSPEEMRNAAVQLKYARPEDMVESTSEKMAKATPEDAAAIHACADAHVADELKEAEMLRQQGNNLHSQGKFGDAAQKYLLAKNNLKSVPISQSRNLQLTCSLNLMSCYLKTKQFEDCIKEGSEVLEYDAENLKALYRRGEAYKDLGKLEAAVADLSKARSIKPGQKTIANALREAHEKLSKAGGSPSFSQAPTSNSEHLQGPNDNSKAVRFC